jgi:beta-phosphoglucomutase-like phosphatase (HAD superfamily)
VSSFTLVTPTTGGASLEALLASLAACDGPVPEHVVVVDNRRTPHPPLSLAAAGWPAARLRLLDSDGRGAAAARTIGWRGTRSEWVCFLEDDVTVEPDWLAALAGDLDAAPPDAAATQARGGTADVAYRRSVLEAMRGFDERPGRAFQEDAELALRAVADGHRFVIGNRRSTQPVRRVRWSDGVGRRVATFAVAGLAVASASRRKRAAWVVAATSLVIPQTAVGQRVRGTLRHRDAPPWAAIAPSLQPPPEPVPIAAVLFDLEGTLLRDSPLEDPPPEPQPGAERALARLRAAGAMIGVLTARAEADPRVEELLGPIDTWQVRPQRDESACDEAPVRSAAAALGVPVERCAVIGDAGADVQAGMAAGAGLTILVPSAATSPDEIYEAPLVFATLPEATDELIINHTRRVAAA